jgi:hypothetical protein
VRVRGEGEGVYSALCLLSLWGTVIIGNLHTRSLYLPLSFAVNFAVALKTGKCENGGIFLSVKSLRAFLSSNPSSHASSPFCSGGLRDEVS